MSRLMREMRRTLDESALPRCPYAIYIYMYTYLASTRTRINFSLSPEIISFRVGRARRAVLSRPKMSQYRKNLVPLKTREEKRMTIFFAVNRHNIFSAVLVLRNFDRDSVNLRPQKALPDVFVWIGATGIILEAY